MRRAIIASLGLFLAVPATGMAETATIGCGHGDITLARLAAGACTAEIPLPTPRPDSAANAVEEQKAARLKREDFRFIETPDPRTGEPRTVRLVGTPYLPQENDTIELRRVSDPVNAAFNSFASVLGVTPAQADEPAPSPAVAAENPTAVQKRLEARADLRILAAHN